MPFVPAPNIIEMEFRYTLDNCHIENRVMVDNLAPVTAADLEALAILGWNWAEATLLPLINSSLLLNEVVTTDQSAIDGGQFSYAPDATTTGGEGDACLPNECAFCVSLHTASRGRSARGRFYVPAIPVSSLITQNRLSTTAASALVSALQTLINAIDTAGQLLVIVSYITGGAPRVGGPVFYPVVSAVATDTIIDSQRRRKPGVGA